MKNTLIKFDYSWPIIETNYKAKVRKVFEISRLDRVICGIVNKVKNKEIHFEELGLLLGLGTKNILDYSETIKFYKDQTEINILSNLLQKCSKFHLIEIDDETSIIKITDWGLHALEYGKKYEFWEYTLSSYSHVNFKLGNQFDFYPFHKFGLTLNLIPKNRLTEAYDFSERKNDLTNETIYYLSHSERKIEIIVDEVDDNNFNDKTIIEKKIDVWLHEDRISFTLKYNELELNQISTSIKLNENSELQAYLQRKGLFLYLLESEELLTSLNLSPYIEDDFFEPTNIVELGKVDWNSNKIFNFFLNESFSDHSLWAAISRISPIKLILQNIEQLKDSVSWTTLTQRAESIEILQTPSLDWDVELIIEQFSEMELLEYIELKLDGVAPVSDSSELTSYHDVFSIYLWNIITEKLSNESLEKHLFDYPLNLRFVTVNNEILCQEFLLEKNKWQNDIFSRVWDWRYISANYNPDFLSQNFTLFKNYLDAESLFLQIAKDEIRLIRFLKSNQTISLKEKLLEDSFQLSSHHQVFLNEETLELLENYKLLAWGENGVSGIETNAGIRWTNPIVMKYGKNIQSDKAFKTVSIRLDEVETAINNNQLSWDWVGIINHYDSNSIYDNWLTIKNYLSTDLQTEAYEALSKKLSLSQAIELCNTLDNIQEFFNWEFICKNSSKVEIEKYYKPLNVLLSRTFSKEVTSICTQKVSLKYILKNKDLSWDWISIIDSYDLFEHWLDIQSFIHVDLQVEAYEILSKKISLSQAVELCSAMQIKQEFFKWELICEKSTTYEVESFYEIINDLILDSSNEVLISICTQKVNLEYILKHKELLWDWSYVSREKIELADAENYFEDLAPFLDWEYITKNLYSNREFNDIEALTKLAWFIDKGNKPAQESAWKYITQQINPTLFWGFMNSTRTSSTFHWDWNIISDSPILMKGHIEDLRSGNASFFIENYQLLNWSSFTGNTYFNGYLIKREFEKLYAWLDRIDNLIAPIVKFLDWSILSANVDFTWNPTVVERCFNYWDWKIFSEYSEFLIKKKGKKVVFNNGNIKRLKKVLDFYILSSRDEIIIDQYFIREFGHENLNWQFISSNPHLNFSWDIFFIKGDINNELIRDKFKQLIIDKEWDFKALSRRKDIPFAPEFILKLIDKDWDWDYFSSEKLVTNNFILETLDKNWNWHLISKNQELVFDEKLISILLEKDSSNSINWSVTSSNPYFHISNRILSQFSEQKLKSLNWNELSRSENLDIEILNSELLDKYSAYWNWEILLKEEKVFLSSKLLLKCHKYIPASMISEHIQPEVLTDSSLRSIRAYFDWSILCQREDFKSLLSNTEFISENKNFLKWEILSNQTHISFTKELINLYYSFWDWSVLKKNPRIVESPEMISFVNSCIENDHRLLFLDKISEQYSDWAGYIYHFTHLSNAIKVLNSSSILSRNSALEELDNFDDAAGSVVSRRDLAHNYARFYFRPQTPTQFYNEELGQDQSSNYESTYSNALNLGLPKCPIPVFFRFRLKDVLFDDEVKYKISNGNMQTNWARPLELNSAIHAFDFNEVYSIFPDYRSYGSYDGFDKTGFRQAIKTYIDKSQQEFLVQTQFDFSNYFDYEIIVKDEFTKEYLLDNLEDEKHKNRIVLNNYNYDVFHNQNRSIHIEKSETKIKIRTDYSNKHRMKITFNDTFEVEEIDGVNIIINRQILEFEEFIYLTLKKKVDYKVEFYNELKSEPWEIIKVGKNKLQDNSYKIKSESSKWEHLFKINYLLNTEVDFNTFIAAIYDDYNPYSVYKKIFHVDYDPTIIVNINYDEILFFICSDVDVSSIKPLLELNNLRAVWSYSSLEKVCIEEKEISKSKLVVVFKNSDEDILPKSLDSNFYLWFNLRILFDHYPETNTNENLIKVLSQNNRISKAYNSKVRHYQLKIHTLLVMNQFDKYFRNIDLPISRNLFRFTLALHDIGKPEAFVQGDKSNQYFYTKQIIEVIQSSLPFEKGELDICFSLISDDPIGKYFQKQINIKDAAALIYNASKNTKLSSNVFLELLIIYYQCDTGSYTKDAGGLAFLEHLFIYEKEDKVFDPEKRRLILSPPLELKLKGLKNEISYLILLEKHTYNEY